MVLNSNQLYKFGWNHSFYDIPKETSKEIHQMYNRIETDLHTESLYSFIAILISI
jgi:hypothetical protein